MPLIDTTETFPERPVVIILVGTPFSYKTSLAITAGKPLLIDAERGAERAHGRAKTYRISNGWAELDQDMRNNKLLDEFNSVVVDTGGSIIDDYLWDEGLRIKYTKNGQQNWGTVKDLFKKFVSFVRGAGKDIIIISHEKSKDEDDERRYDLDISGSGKQILLRQADQVGFITKQDFKENGKIITKTILTFNPTKSLPFCKNVAQLADIELPDCKSAEWIGFMDREIVQKTKKAISSMSEEQAEVLKLIDEWRSSIDATVKYEDVADETFDGELKEMSSAIAAITPEHIKLQIRNYYLAHLTKIGWKWNAKEKKFEPVAKPVEEKPVDSEPVTETSAADQPKEDLFADNKAE